MSKYLFILPNFKIGGAEHIVQLLISKLDHTKNEYDLFFLSDIGEKKIGKTLSIMF